MFKSNPYMTATTSRAISTLFMAAQKAMKNHGKRAFFSGRDKGREAFGNFLRQMDTVVEVAVSEGDMLMPNKAELLNLLIMFEEHMGNGNWKPELQLMIHVLTHEQAA